MSSMYIVIPDPVPLPQLSIEQQFLENFLGGRASYPRTLLGENRLGYKLTSDSIGFVNTYGRLFREVWSMERTGLSAAVYTQLTDVETEINGLMTYDRKILKIAPGQACRIDHNEVPTLPGTKASRH